MSAGEGLVYVGKIVLLEAIDGADNIVSATVVCDKGGKWRGVVKKGEFGNGEFCIVYLPDSLLPQDDPRFSFMQSRDYRVRMCRFRGAPSEVLIMPIDVKHPVEGKICQCDFGLDITQRMQVTKYHKPVPVNLQGKAKGFFPDFIPKTDEVNYQRNQDLVEALHGQPYYVTEKADGSSTTAFRYRGRFGLCSRNLELEEDSASGYWEIAYRYDLKSLLPEGFALQWETCGPKIQGNPMGFSRLEGLAFSVYDIKEHKYLEKDRLVEFCSFLDFPMVSIVEEGDSFDKTNVDNMGGGTYKNGKQREGVVVRSLKNIGSSPISFKVINLSYEK